jgi:hypothetical protein
MSEDGVRRPEGTIQSYKESVHHQFVSTIENLNTLKVNTKAMYKDYWDGRKYNISKESKYANQTFVVLPSKNYGRLNSLVDKLKAQDIEVFKNTKTLLVDKAVNQLGDIEANYEIPEGSLIIPNRQPEAPLIKAILEFDAEIDESVLIEERQENLRDGSSIMYDTTAFNFTMMFGLPAVTALEHIDKNIVTWEPSSSNIEVNDNAVMWATNGDDDRSVAFAARLLEEDIQVRIIDKESILSGHKLSRGSVVVIAMDNLQYENLTTQIKEIAADLNISVHSIESGFGPEELPDWGGRHFRLLKKPQIAILGHGNYNSYDVGVSWWSLDHHLGIRHSLVNGSFAGYADLRRYNTLILPSGYPDMSASELENLSEWIKNGGTLIAHNRSTRFLSSNDGLGNTKQIQNVFEDVNDYKFDLMREIMALDDQIDKDKVNSNSVDNLIDYPWELNESEMSKGQFEMRDEWQSIFMPSGSFVAGRTDQKHWLTFGSPNILPVLYSDYPVLMTGSNVEAAVRIGALVPNLNSLKSKQINWSLIPPNKDIKVRMSGLVWPEAAQRIANSAYVTREKIGKGQVILFSGEPNFRGSTRGTNRLWLNAVVFGSGLGTNPTINP